MRKSIIISLVLYIICNVSMAQTAYYDAVDLKKYVQKSGSNLRFQALPGDTDGFIKILKKYVKPSARDTLNNSKDLFNYFEASGNKFITAYLNSGGVLSSSDDLKVATGISKTGSATGGLNVTSVADGLAKFLVKRTKQELSITFFEKFMEVLDDPKNKDFKDLFPKTYTVLKIIDKEIYQFSNYLNTLKEAFENDLQNMLNRLEPYLETKKGFLKGESDIYENEIITINSKIDALEAKQGNHKTEIDDFNTEISKLKAKKDAPKKIEYFQSALLIINNLRQGTHPAEAIGKLENQIYDPINTPLLNLQQAIKLFNIFSNSLKSEDQDKYWVDSNALKSLLDPTTFNIYLGLLYQQHGDDIIFGNKFSSYLDLVVGDIVKIKKYQDFINQLITDSEKVSLAIQGIKQKKKTGEKIDSYGELFHSTLGFLRNFENVKTLNPSFEINNLNDVLEVLEILNDIYLDVNERKYNALILDLSQLLTELFGDKFGWNDNLIKYGSFIANVAQAENSDQVQAAIEAIALPVGSASIKKKSKQNIALNAYVGLSPGIEHNGDTGKYNFSFGVNAPIGIAISNGIYDVKKDKEKGSSTWFVSLIDLGAVTSYRFGDSDTENIPEIKLENIFAPGLFYVYGLPKWPLSIGLGGQLGPQLRKITNDAISLQSKATFSFRIFVAIDIPLLNFYTKSR